MCTYVHVCVHMCICIRVCVCVCLCVCIRVFVCMCVYMYMHVCVMCMYVYVFVCVHVHESCSLIGWCWGTEQGDAPVCIWSPCEEHCLVIACLSFTSSIEMSAVDRL